MNVIFCLLTSDPARDDKYRFWQLHCVQRLFDVKNISLVNQVARGLDLLESGCENWRVCSWKGVQCDDMSFIRSIRWAHLARSNYLTTLLDIRWLPPTLLNFNVENIYVKEEFINTSELPRNLDMLTMKDCHLSGEIELRTLPTTLQDLNLYQNELCGMVNLTCLPPNMRTINLGKNCFRSVVVLNSSLPLSLKQASFYSNPKVRFICLDSSRQDPRVNSKSISLWK